MNKKSKVFVFLAIIFFIIILLIIIRIVINKNKSKTSIDDFSSIKELVEYDGHKYITMKNSKEQDFSKDIYILFSKPTINDDGTTNQRLYEILISHLAGMLKGKNFRLIDTDKNIVVKIKFDDNDEVSVYTINDDSKYWEHIQTNYQIDNLKKEQLSNFTVESQILANIINNNWIYNNINLGSKESTVDNYEIYYNEGYKVRKIGSKIYNIIFTHNYNEQVLNGITTITSVENVENILGKPTFEDNINNIIGYKSKYFYIFFTGDEISIYPAEKYDEQKSKKFGELVTELNKTGDINTFLNKLTDLYPDYESYSVNNNYVDIQYPLLGFAIKMGYPNENGIILYSNFQGWITENIKIDDLISNKVIPINVYTMLDNNLVLKVEGDRVSNERYLDSGGEFNGGEE